MPKFYKEVDVECEDTYVDVDVYVDIDVEEYLDECSSKEIKKVINFLIDEEHIKSDKVVVPINSSINEIYYEVMVNKLHDKYLSLSDDEYEVIKKITSRF